MTGVPFVVRFALDGVIYNCPTRSGGTLNDAKQRPDDVLALYSQGIRVPGTELAANWDGKLLVGVWSTWGDQTKCTAHRLLDRIPAGELPDSGGVDGGTLRATIQSFLARGGCADDFMAALVGPNGAQTIMKLAGSGVVKKAKDATQMDVLLDKITDHWKVSRKQISVRCGVAEDVRVQIAQRDNEGTCGLAVSVAAASELDFLEGGRTQRICNVLELLEQCQDQLGVYLRERGPMQVSADELVVLQLDNARAVSASARELLKERGYLEDVRVVVVDMKTNGGTFAPGAKGEPKVIFDAADAGRFEFGAGEAAVRHVGQAIAVVRVELEPGSGCLCFRRPAKCVDYAIIAHPHAQTPLIAVDESSLSQMRLTAFRRVDPSRRMHFKRSVRLSDHSAHTGYQQRAPRASFSLAGESEDQDGGGAARSESSPCTITLSLAAVGKDAAFELTAPDLKQGAVLQGR